MSSREPRRITITALALAAVACSGVAAPASDPDVDAHGAPSRQVELGVGEARTVGTAQVRFIGVTEDSRCPIDAVCVWMGNAAAEIELALDGGSPETLVLNSSIEPRSTERSGLVVRLVSVQPAARSTVTIAPGDYVIELEVGPAR